MNLHDERPIREQIRSGFAIVAKLLSAFAIATTFLIGCGFIRGSGPHEPTLGWGLIAASIVIMVTTVRFWAAGFVGFLVYGALRSVGGILAPTAFHTSRTYMAVLFASAFAMSVLGFRFTKKRIEISHLDRASIVTAASCVLVAFLFAEAYKAAVVFNVGNAALLFSWLVARTSRHVGHKKHHPRNIAFTN